MMIQDAIVESAGFLIVVIPLLGDGMGKVPPLIFAYVAVQSLGMMIVLWKVLKRQEMNGSKTELSGFAPKAARKIGLWKNR